MATIVVIDDSDTTRQFFKKTLSKDHEVYTAKAPGDLELDLEEADLVFLDCWLEEDEGIDVLESIRDSSDVPVVMISGYADQSIVSRAREAGVHGFLQKPFEPDQIREKVDIVLTGEGDDDRGPDVQEVSFYGSPSVLIVEDNRSTIDLLSRPLDHYDIDYGVAHDTDEALEYFHEHEPEIIVIEATVPGSLSAAELHDRITSESDPEFTFFIGMTDQPESEEIDSFRKEELVDVFYKPFAVDRFVRSLAHLSFVIDRRDEGDDVSEDKAPDSDESWIGSGLRKAVTISVIFIIVGVLLGFVVQWTQQWVSSVGNEATTIEKMYEEIEGYLRRDEDRERQQLNQ